MKAYQTSEVIKIAKELNPSVKFKQKKDSAGYTTNSVIFTLASEVNDAVRVRGFTTNPAGVSDSDDATVEHVEVLTLRSDYKGGIQCSNKQLFAFGVMLTLALRKKFSVIPSIDPYLK